MIKVIAYQVADSIDIRSLKKGIAQDLHYSDAEEILYQPEEKKLVYVFKYGVICFTNFKEEEIKSHIAPLHDHFNNPLSMELREELIVETHAPALKFGYDKIAVEHADTESMRIIMLNVAQSVAMDYFMKQTETLMEETTHHTKTLEQKGKLDLSGKHLRKFIGKTLNLKNRIQKNLFIFDSPEAAWENENLDKINSGLKNIFDIQIRYRTINQELQTIKENLDLFKDIMQYRQSNLLEWVVIALFLIEIVNLLWSKLK